MTADLELDPDVLARMVEIAERPETADVLAEILKYGRQGAVGSTESAPSSRPRSRPANRAVAT